MNEKQLIILVGPCGSGKSTLAKEYVAQGYEYVNQDSQGRKHLDIFDLTVINAKNIIVDRMNFTKGQRSRYLDIAKKYGYRTKIIVLHESYDTCMERMLAREGHETIKDKESARSALGMFFSKYERVEDTEADEVERRWPNILKPLAIWSDLDGTLCDCEHRRGHIKKPIGEKKDWTGFFKAMSDDKVNVPVLLTLKKFATTHEIVYCSGRPDNYRRETAKWLRDNNAPEGKLFMRPRNDSRQDNIVKEILLDFEVLTRYTPLFFLDDRDQVVKMLRSRGFTVFQVNEGDF